MRFGEAAAFVFAQHWRLAILAAGVFFAGMMSAVVVVRCDVRSLMAFPLWLMRFLARYLKAHPHFTPVFLLIFLFNGTAMCLYMLSGVAPALPLAVAFLTGMNIAIVGLAGGGMMNEELGEGPPVTGERPADKALGELAGDAARAGCLRGLSFLLTVGLELPAFWFALAMGASLTGAHPWWTQADPHAVLAAGVAKRLLAYAMVLLPVLAVSAAVESVGVLLGLHEARRRARRPPPNDPPPQDEV